MIETDWTLELLTSWESIEDANFLKYWTDLVERASNSHVFFHPILSRVWLDTYRPLRNLRPLFVCASCGEQQVLFPLVLWRRNWKNAWLRVVVPVGYSDFDYHDPLFLLPPTRDEVESFYQALYRELDHSVRYDQIIIDGLHELYLPPKAAVTHSAVCLSWSLSTVKPIDGLVLPAKKRLAQDVRRRFHRIREVGEVRFRRFARKDISAAQNSLSIMLPIHAKRWPNAYKAPGFHRRLLNDGLLAGLLDFIELSLDGRPIAWQIGFNWLGCYSHYLPAVDGEFLKYGTGHLSLSYALAEAAAAGMITVDHLRGGEQYKSAWGGGDTLIYDVALKNKALAGRLRLAAQNAFGWLKRYKEVGIYDQVQHPSRK